MRLSIIFILALFYCTSAFSQVPRYINYTVDDGLASNETYNILEDSKGNLWIGTDQGISIYNGYEFKNLSVKDGLPDNTIFGFSEDRKGRIWLRSLNGGLAYVENGNVHKILTEYDFGYINSIYVDPCDTVWFSLSYSQFKAYPEKDGNYTCEKLNDYYFVREIDQSEDGIIIGYFRKTGDNYYYVNGKSYLFDDLVLLWGNALNRALNGVRISPSRIVVDLGKSIVSVGEGEETVLSTYDKSQDILLQMSGDSLLLIGTNSGGVITDKNGREKKRLLDGVAVSSVARDREGGYWTSTLANGVYYFPSDDVTVFELEPTSRITEMIRDENGDLFAFGYYGSVMKQDGSRFVKTYESNDRQVDDFLYCSFNKDNELVGNYRGFYVRMKDNKRFENKGNIQKFEFSNGVDAFHYAGQFFATDRQTGELVVDTVGHKRRLVHSLVYQNGDTVFIPTLEGLYRFDVVNGMYCVGDDYPLLKRRVNVFEKDSADRLWIGTNEMGIFVLAQGHLTSINQINPEIGLICRSIEVGKENVWASTEKGLVKISLSDYSQTQTYTTEDGLLSNGIRCVYPDGDFVYLGHDDGITKFPLNYQKKAIHPLIEINEIQVNNERRNQQEYYRLNHTEKHLKISFTGISFNAKLRYKYRFREPGNSAPWKFTQNRSVEFLSIPPGSYVFEVVAINSSGLESQSSACIYFTIAKPYWKEWWFYFIVITGFLVVVYFYGRRKVRKFRVKLALERQLIEVEQKALRSRMNPHFIFNSLNSIQAFILQNDRQSANKYLSEFSKLIRAILEDSDKKLIPISRELTTLKSYINAELLRVKNKFNYEIIIAENINTNYYKMPPLLLQPYVENAIWHGIMNKATNGHLKIEILNQNTHLLIVIEDDGIGREKAMEIKSKTKIKHQSAGLEITANRIDLVKLLYGSAFSVRFKDLKQDEIPMGTRVEIQLPYLK